MLSTNPIKKGIISLVSFLSYGHWNPGKAYDLIYEGQSRSPLFSSIVRDAFGSEYPDDAEGFSFVTRTDLTEMTSLLGIGTGACFADLACGRGGPGLWIARANGADLTGVDISEQGIAMATGRIKDFGLMGRARFRTGSFSATGFPDGSLDGAVSIDALWLAPDRGEALGEASRILKTGARFVFTTWDGNVPFRRKDHRGELTAAGFRVTAYHETTGWRERQLAVYASVLARRDELVREMGERYARPLIREARSAPRVMEKSMRIMVAAEKV